MNAFQQTIADIGHGDLSDQAAEQFAQLIQAVRETAKEGKITLTINVKPRGRDTSQVEVTGKIALSAPVADIAPVMMFASEDGTLTRHNPNQLKLPFGEQEDAPKPVSKASNE
jgi:hypothetical protein